jgi:hypothetical protein
MFFPGAFLSFSIAATGSVAMTVVLFHSGSVRARS